MPIRMEDTHVALIEQGVPPHEQTMTLEKPFWLFFSGNMLIAVWLFGLFIANVGLSLQNTLAIIFIANIIATIPLALLATMGPKSRLSQMEASRLSLGKAGSRIGGFLNWIDAVGWDAINNVPSVAAFITFLALYGPVIPFWVALAGFVFIQMLIGIYGHHLVQIVMKYAGWVFLTIVVFSSIGVFSHGITPLPAKTNLFKDFVAAISITIGGMLTFAPYMTDYTRYLPVRTASRKIFWSVFMGLYISTVLVECLGVLTAGTITDLTPAGLVSGLSGMAGHYAPIVLLIIALSSTPVNAMNDNSASYSIISAGLRLSRPITAVLGAALGYVLAAWGSGRFTEAFENYLLFLFYWIAPWSAILLVHWFKIGRHEEEHPYSKGWTNGTTIFVVTTIATMILFSGSPIYTSPVAKALGGIDIGCYVGFAVAGLWYWATLRKTTNIAQD